MSLAMVHPWKVKLDVWDLLAGILTSLGGLGWDSFWWDPGGYAMVWLLLVPFSKGFRFCWV